MSFERAGAVKPGSRRGERVGPYRIERLLGRGGMGAVYLAVREDDYQQQVALKLVSRDAGSEEIISRFYTERQILAGLQHPGIARLLDGGVSDDGWPYLVMEYVEGERIDRYCDARGLSLRERIELFRRVCHAVQFAHQNLVVHRDIKAGNVMVNADGHPRLLDFGIAKVLGADQRSASLTRPGRSPMTPAYASPEQIQHEPITTACDVYALGMLLYRLLAGRLPYRLEGLNFLEIFNVVCRQEPKRPSLAVLEEDPPSEDDRPTELTEMTDDTPVAPSAEDLPRLAAGRPGPRAAGAPRRLSRRLAGDLDAIVLKALRKEPRDRYGSAAELAEDLHRHLVGLPVMARQGTWLYNLGKFVRRNRLGLAILLVIAGFAVTTTVLWRQAVEERRRAVRVTEFLEDLFKFANPDEAQGETLTVYEILRRGRARVAEGLAEEPEIQAEIMGTLASVYGNLGLYEEAIELRREALNTRRTSDSRARSDLAKDINNWAHILFTRGDFQNAEPHFREALAMRRRLGQDDKELTTIRFNLASTLDRLGRYEEAEELHRQVLEVCIEEHGPESPEVARSLYGLGALYTNLGDFELAETYLRQALEIRSAIRGREHTEVAQVLHSLGLALHANGARDEALVIYQEALAIRRRILGDDHVSVAHTRKNLAALHLDRGEIETGGRLIDQALTTLRLSLPKGSSTVLDAERVLGTYLFSRGRYSEAEAYLVASFRGLREIRGPLAWPTRDALSRLIALYEAWDRPAKAAEYRSIAEQLRVEREQEKGS